MRIIGKLRFSARAFMHKNAFTCLLAGILNSSASFYSFLAPNSDFLALYWVQLNKSGILYV
ncbi:hypothetical protein BCU91_19545 [Shewanella sp. 10N.286.52.B9]|nr:hypothetical protein BCU91_19545 [Shewanella sp. 10N.286.52.B9]